MEQSLSLDLDQHRALYMSTGHTGNNENKVMRISLQLLCHMLNINIKWKSADASLVPSYKSYLYVKETVHLKKASQKCEITVAYIFICKLFIK